MQNDVQVPHKSVLLDEVLHYLDPKDGEIHVDGTFGAGGYSKAILGVANCKLYAIDQDPSVKEYADKIKKEFPNQFDFIQGNFGSIENLLRDNGVSVIDGIVLDLGVSSMQIDQADRGFSFKKDGPLDMRMSCEGESAADFVNNRSEEEIADVIYKYGGERKSRRIARAIVGKRAEKKFETTSELKSVVHSAVKKYNDTIDPATRTFQAIRIWVNRELQELQNFLEKVCNLLAPGGRIVIVTFHSLEDSIVKNFFKKLCGVTAGVNRHVPISQIPSKGDISEFKLITRKVVVPTGEEIKNNIRSRSAKLRAIVKLESKNGGEND